MKKLLLPCLLLFNVISASGQVRDTFNVYFALNDPKLRKPGCDYIDKLIFNGILIHGQKLIVLGYADYLGGSAYNDSLSATRAQNVKNYLVASGFDKSDTKLCIGKGKIDRAPVGNDGSPQDRKVQIIIDRARRPDTSLTGSSKHRKDTSFIKVPPSGLKVNATYPLNILFENASSIIVSKSYPELKKLYDFMIRNKTVRIQIEGHICCISPIERVDGHDVRAKGPLSLNRAKSIYDFLIDHGISKDRLAYVGLAGTVPKVYPEKTEDDREQNRRVEIRILSK